MADLTPQERERIYLEEKARMEAKKSLESKQAKKGLNTLAGCCLIILAIPVGIGILSALLGGTSKKGPASAPKLSAEEKKRFGKHGPSPDLYELRARVEYSLKKIARDPDSVKVYEWSDIFYNENDGWIIRADWGAKNGFGGMTRETNWFVVSKKNGYQVKPGDAYK